MYRYIVMAMYMMKHFVKLTSYVLAAALTLAASDAVSAMEISKGLNLDGQKVVSYKMTNSADNNEVKQNLKLNLRGNINENLTTDLVVDDSLNEKFEKMSFVYRDEKMKLELGDINFNGITSFGRSEKKLRGMIANVPLKNNAAEAVTFLCTFESGKAASDRFVGEGRPGPFKLANDKLSPQSDRVYIDGVQKNRNIDYGVDYDNGILTFNEDVPLGAEIYVQYSIETSFDNVDRYSFGAFAETAPGEKVKTRFGVMRSQESAVDETLAAAPKTEFNLSQDIDLTEKLSTRMEYSRSFKDYSQPGEEGRDGAAYSLHAKLEGKLADTNLKMSSVGASYSPYNSRYVVPEKNSEFSFDLHPEGERFGLLNGMVGTVGILKKEPLVRTGDSGISDEDRFFGKFLYNVNEQVSVNSNFQNAGSAFSSGDVKVTSRSSKLNIENGYSSQKRNGGIDELNTMTFRASTFPIKRNVYFVEYNDSVLRSFSKVKDENSDVNFKVRRKITDAAAATYSAMGSTRRNYANSETSFVENRAGLDYNLNSGTSVTGQVAARSERRTAAFEPRAEMGGVLLGAKYVPLDFLKVLFKREYWNVGMESRAREFAKSDDSVKFIIAPPGKPYTLELKGGVRSPEYDMDSGARRGVQKNGGAQFDVRAGSRLKFVSEIMQKENQDDGGLRTLNARQEVKYKVNDDMDFFFNIEKEKTLFTNIVSLFRLEARL